MRQNSSINLMLDFYEVCYPKNFEYDKKVRNIFLEKLFSLEILIEFYLNYIILKIRGHIHKLFSFNNFRDTKSKSYLKITKNFQKTNKIIFFFHQYFLLKKNFSKEIITIVN